MKTKPANNEEAEDEEEAEEARRTRRSQRWGIERVPIKSKESREPKKRERASGGEAEEVPGSTLEGGRRRCNTCGKTFAERDVASFRKHVCGRAQGGTRGEAETAERKERRGRTDGENGEEEEGEGDGDGRRAKKARASAEGKDDDEGGGEGKEDDEGEGEGIEARKAAKREERERKRAERERPVRDGPPPQVKGSWLTTVKGRQVRECKACGKTFAPFDVDSFKKHVCGRKAGERGVAPARAEREGERRGAGGEAKWEWRRETRDSGRDSGRDGGRGERRPTLNGREPASGARPASRGDRGDR